MDSTENLNETWSVFFFFFKLNFFQCCPSHWQLFPQCIYMHQGSARKLKSLMKISLWPELSKPRQKKITMWHTENEYKTLSDCIDIDTLVEKSKTSCLHHTYLWFLKQGKNKFFYLRIFNIHWTYIDFERFLSHSLKLLGFTYFKCH